MRVQPKKMEEYPWLLRNMFKKQEKKYGQPLFPAMLWGRHPWLLLLIIMFLKYFERKSATIDTVLRSLVMVRIAQLNSCTFCIDLNEMILLNKGGSMDKADALGKWKESDLFTPAERAALDYADAITLSDRQVTDEIMETLKKYLNDDEVVELTGLIGYQNLSAKFNSALDVPAQGLCKKPA